MERKPDITDEEVGMETFHLRKRKGVERAIEKIRNGLKKDFLKLSQDEIKILEWALGETWTLMGFYEWERIAFSTLSLEEVDKIISIAREIISHKKPGIRGLEEIHSLLKAKLIP